MTYKVQLCTDGAVCRTVSSFAKDMDSAVREVLCENDALADIPYNEEDEHQVQWVDVDEVRVMTATRYFQLRKENEVKQP